ncbi:MAG: hypothetical protein AB7T59_01045 [Hyphomonadaceae bacterium]
MSDVRYSFTVIGSGDFPRDVMDAEQAWPATAGDAEAVSAAGERRVDLEAPQAPDVARWNAAGWIVREWSQDAAAALDDAEPGQGD